MHKVCVIRGDGVGPEVMDSCLEVTESLGLNLVIEHAKVGTELYKEEKTYISSETINLAQEADAILFGTIITPNDMNFVSPKLLLRWNLDLYANVRPLRCLHPDLGPKDLDIVVVRENSEGMYGAIEREVDGKIITERVTTEKGCQRIIDFAFEFAVKNNRKKMTCVHKANILRSSDEMFRQLFYGSAVNFAYYHKIKSDDLLVDDAAMHIAKEPDIFDTIVTLNLYGDILSEEIAGLIGGSTFAPSANFGGEHTMFLPAHGPMPDMAGKDVVNPIASILSGAMMLRHLGHLDEDRIIEQALRTVMQDRNKWTRDIGGECSTSEFTKHVINEIIAILEVK